MGNYPERRSLMKSRMIFKYMIVMAACVLLSVIAFRGVAAAGDKDASYYLLYKARGSAFQAYIQTKGGVKSYQYAQSMQNFGDIIGKDRTGDLHEIEKPGNAAGDVLIDVKELTLSKEAGDQFMELQNSLEGSLKDSSDISDITKKALLKEVGERKKSVSAGDASYMIPLDCYLELEDVTYDESDPDKATGGTIKTFMYKKKSNVAIIDGEADLSGKNMTSAMLWNKDLGKITMAGSWLCQAVIADCDISKGDLAGSTLLGTLVAGCDMSGCDLSDADLSGAVFIGTDMRGADFEGTTFEDTVFKCLGDKKVRIDKKWKNKILSHDVTGAKNIEWI